MWKVPPPGENFKFSMYNCIKCGKSNYCGRENSSFLYKICKPAILQHFVTNLFIHFLAVVKDLLRSTFTGTFLIIISYKS